MKKILVLGSAALKIGEAGEFDYSGSQAIKALREEGLEIVLVNPNIATVQTSQELASKVYFLPVDPHFVSEVIKKEKPDGILLSFGGQTALNCGVELFKSGFLKDHNVKVLGTPVEAIINTEDRQLFADNLRGIDVKTPRSAAANSLDDAIRIADQIGYPIMIRIAYALGGLGSGFCKDKNQLIERAEKAFSYADQILVEEYLEGWKEVEYEVMRDSADNCITVCNMENFDPLGIHTGESIVVAPSQTLSNDEYHKLRELSIRIVRNLGIVGECNVQFALDPFSEDYRVIEVNARLSRSSALASKATGYPLAFIAAKLALGKTLPELKNSVTQTTSACFEPALDYVVVKIPRWDLEKFRMVSKKIGSSMKSVGEVMSIGRKFEEALQKAIRMLAVGSHGLVGDGNLQIEDIKEELKSPTNERIFAIVESFKRGFTVDQVYDLTRIDRWFLYRILDVVNIGKKLWGTDPKTITPELLREAKQYGYCDTQISFALNVSRRDARDLRKRHGILPAIKQIDTLAAEYPAQTNYLYLTYNGDEDDVGFPGCCHDNDAILRTEPEGSSEHTGSLPAGQAGIQREHSGFFPR
ncbi:carbamoyl-phosphate synthase large subunit [bacterium]|nr:carbamoyl-phosphate synthase large subunit [bacterium]